MIYLCVRNINFKRLVMYKKILYLLCLIKRAMLKARIESKQPQCDASKAERAEQSQNAMIRHLQHYLMQHYSFRFNVLTEQAEYAPREGRRECEYQPVLQRDLNTFCLEAKMAGIGCWDKDVPRLLISRMVEDYHPFHHYMKELPQWDGVDRVKPLARRVSSQPLWVEGFHRWMLGVAAQWMGRLQGCANAVAPLLVSRAQGMRKSTFCMQLMPPQLSHYYLDKFDLNSDSGCEQKLTLFGLINMDEFDKYRPGQMPVLKNLMQMTRPVFRKAYRPSYTRLPRIASMIGTSNYTDLLCDPTGSRRFLCVEVKEKIDCSTPIEHDQLYAQLKSELASGERYWFTSQEEQAIQAHNLGFTHTPPEAEVFHRCFRLPHVDEVCTSFSATQVFNHLRKRFPAVMRGVTPSSMGKVLVAVGAQRTRVATGSVYRLVMREK